MTADELRPSRCAVVGDPVAHSLSPALHNAAYAEAGLAWAYEAVQVPAGGLAAFAAGLDGTWAGLSVTMPLKREALALAAQASDVARLAGAANTLLRGEGGWHADNTDVGGAMAALSERWREPFEAATIWGGGATAASTGLALASLGAGRIRVLARSAEAAEPAVAAIRAHPSSPEVELLGLDAPVIGALLVSTIPASAQRPELVARAVSVPVVFDVVYDPWPTPLAGAATGVLVSGLDLLVHQAARQFQAFTGLPAPLDVMRDAGREALSSRGDAR